MLVNGYVDWIKPAMVPPVPTATAIVSNSLSSRSKDFRTPIYRQRIGPPLWNKRKGFYHR